MIRFVGKLLDQQFNESVFSNPGGNILITAKCRGKICPVVLNLVWTLSPGLKNKDKW